MAPILAWWRLWLGPLIWMAAGTIPPLVFVSAIWFVVAPTAVVK